MAGIDPPELVLPMQPEIREPRTLLKGQALYTTDINGYIDGISSNSSKTHEVEVNVDQDGVVSMDIYTPRTLINSIPLCGGVVPIGVIDNFQVIPSNNRENALCVIHQTAEGLKHEYLIFRRREEMHGWLAHLNREVLTNPIRTRTDPTFDHFPPNTNREGNADCVIPEGADASRQEDFSPTKLPVEDDYSFEDDINSEDDHTSAPSDGPRWGSPSITDPGIDSGVSQAQMGASPASISETLLPVPPVPVTARSPLIISTIGNTGEISQRARCRHSRTKSNGEIFSLLRQETHMSQLTVSIPVEDACLLKMFDYQDHAWVRDCSGCSEMHAGDLITTINGEKVTSTQVFRDQIEAMTAEGQVVQLTVKRLPEASLLMVRTRPDGGIPFTTEGTKVRSVDVESEDGLFKIVKDGNAYITGVNSRFVPYSSTTAEVTAHLQNAGDEFFLVLHPRELAEKMQ